MIFTDIERIMRPLDSLTFEDIAPGATITGEATWVDTGLEIPFSRTLTTAEIVAVTRRITSSSAEVEQARKLCQDFLAINSPSPTESRDQVRRLTTILERLIPIVDQATGMGFATIK